MTRRQARNRPAPQPRKSPTLTERIAGWSAGHRKTVVIGWLLLVAAVFMGGQALGSRNLPQYDAGQSGTAERVLNQVATAQYNGASEDVLIQAKTPGATFATDPAMRQAASQVAAALAALPGYAGDIRTPLQPGGQALVSKDGRSALVTFQVPGNVTDPGKAVTALQHAVAGVQADHADLRVAETGDASIGEAINGALNFSKAEATSVPIMLILLLAVFGALVAAGIPVLLALTSLTAAIGVLTAVSHLLPVNGSTFEVVVIIGMAVGVDYALFYLRREREERALGRSFPEALRIASRTSGRAIVVSGLTVMATMAGLFLVGGGPFSGMALGTIAVVGISVAGSLTVLPALLAWLGPKADAGRIPFLGRRRAAARPSRFWGGLARRVVARPLIWGGIATVAMLALAAPALGLRVGQPAIDAPKNVAPVTTMEAVQRAFPQAPAPAEIVVTGQDLTGPRVTAAVDELRARAAAGGPVRQPVTVTELGGGRALLVGVQLAGSGTDTASNNALLTLRNQILPDTLGKVPGVSYAVTGDTAGLYDDIHQEKLNPAPRVRVRRRARVRPAAYGIQVADRAAGVDRAQPAVRRRGLRPDHADLPGRALAGPARLHGVRRDHLLGAADDVRVPVRDQHGLPRVHPEQDPRDVGARLLAGAGHHRRHRVERRGGDERRADHGGGLLHLHHAAARRPEDPRRRHRRRHPHRRHGRSAASCCPPPSHCSATVPGAAAALLASATFPGQPGYLVGWNASSSQRSPSFTQTASALLFSTRVVPSTSTSPRMSCRTTAQSPCTRTLCS